MDWLGCTYWLFNLIIVVYRWVLILVKLYDCSFGDVCVCLSCVMVI